MARRLQLQQLLEETSGLDRKQVYFQPATNTRMLYPCIVYQRSSTDTIFADNKPFRKVKRWEVTVIDQDPDSEIPDKIAELPLCVHNRFFAADNLNHDVYTLFF